MPFSVSRQHDCSNRSGISVKRSTRGLSSFVNHPHLDIGAHALPRACRRLFLKLPQPRSRRARQVVALMLSNRLEVDFAQQSAIECMPQTSCSYLYHCGPIPRNTRRATRRSTPQNTLHAPGRPPTGNRAASPHLAQLPVHLQLLRATLPALSALNRSFYVGIRLAAAFPMTGNGDLSLHLLPPFPHKQKPPVH